MLLIKFWKASNLQVGYPQTIHLVCHLRSRGLIFSICSTSACKVTNAKINYIFIFLSTRITTDRVRKAACKNVLKCLCDRCQLCAHQASQAKVAGRLLLSSTLLMLGVTSGPGTGLSRSTKHAHYTIRVAFASSVI